MRLFIPELFYTNQAAASTLDPCSRNCSFTLALSCLSILSWRGIRRASPQTILPPLAAAPLTGCYTRLVYSDFRLFNPLTASACTVPVLSISRYRSLTLALSCVHILSWRGCQICVKRIPTIFLPRDKSVHTHDRANGMSEPREPGPASRWPPQPSQAASCGWFTLTSGFSIF